MNIITNIFKFKTVTIIPTFSIYYDNNFYFADYKKCFSIAFIFLKYMIEINILFNKKRGKENEKN